VWRFSIVLIAKKDSTAFTIRHDEQHRSRPDSLRGIRQRMAGRASRIVNLARVRAP
jgi:hypothetical protein